MSSNFPPNFEQKLGFDVIRQILSDYCLSTLGQVWVMKMAFSTDASEIHTSLQQTSELKAILQFEDQFPAQDYYDLIPELLRIRIPGTYMETEQLSELKLSVLTISELLLFLAERKEKFPALYSLANGSGEHETGFSPLAAIPLLQSIVSQVERILDDKSEVRDSASPELNRIRKEKSRLQSSVEHKILQSFKLARQNGWTPDEAEVTIRNGRLVIPMINTHKRKIQGFVHDESATGHTVYIEPSEIFETNNEIRELDYAERREIVRILIEFARTVRPEIDILVHAYHFLGKIDFVRSKARFAISVKGINPIHHPPARKEGSGHSRAGSSDHKTDLFSWHQAIHPLLFLSHQKQKKEVTPLDIALNHDQRILIISGPNAGGKSVCLKTVGLVQYMFQCGLLPPVREDSEFCVFHKIFIDIGDEQSIDNDLSTYSSKLINLKYFIENIDQYSLFLIDEMGTGTDPSLGGAIAEATLEALNAKSAMGVVTTHYSNLKLLAAREQGIVNGAMLYDLKKLKPLFQLKIGKPGSSFALEIAQAIGFPNDVLTHAKSKTGKSQLDFDRELQNLEVEKQEIDQKNTELRVADDFLAELIHKYEKLNADLDSKKKEIIEKARAEARQLLDNSNKIIEKTIKEIRESQAEKSRTKEIRVELSELKEKLLREPGIEIQNANSKVQHSKSQISNLKSEISDLKSQIPNPKSEISDPKSEIRNPKSFLIGSEAKPHRFQSYFDDLHTKLTNFSITLDLRGSRVDEALALLQRYIDDAILCSIPEVQILHGKGNGVLRQVTRDYLRSQKEVKSARDAPLEGGGAGITVVSFR
ncbi:MAG: Smr/MutS family protein [Bacteroidetes bacterium]|nr:Smr/MutS family protein [Bacteroidota bacterium]